MKEQNVGKFYQLSTLQALALGYSKSVITVRELLGHGDLGLGTFEDVDGEMIVLDGKCYRALHNGDVVPAEGQRGVPFAAVCRFRSQRLEECGKMETIEQLKEWLTLRIEEDFGLNSMYAVRIDGEFEKVDARSEYGTKAHGGHVFDISMAQGTAAFCRITRVEIQIPDSPAFDTYALKGASQEDIKSVEQGKK